jgi:hypothetical protein
MKAMRAVLFFNDGWSIHMAMSKAGFNGNWSKDSSISTHPLIKTIRAMNRDNFYNKKKLIKGE